MLRLFSALTAVRAVSASSFPVALVSALVASAPSSLLAQQPAPTAEQREEASGHFKQGVELFRDGQILSRATVSADQTHATADIDTTQIANGALTLTAHAWNSAAGQPSTSDADAGPLTVTVNNPVASNPQHLILGAYAGNDVAAIQQFETWLGRRVDGILGYTGNASWADYDGSVGWAAGLWSG